MGRCSLDGNHIVNLKTLKSFIEEVSHHTITCGIVVLLREKSHGGLASTIANHNQWNAINKFTLMKTNNIITS